MGDDVLPSKKQPIAAANPVDIVVKGGRNTIYGQTGIIQDIRNTVLIAGGQQNHRDMPMRTDWEYDYYNLFVIGGETFLQFSRGDFIVPKEDALTHFVAEDIAEEIQKLDEAAIDRVKGFFCIFAPRNADYAAPGSEQNALLGVITEIQRQDEGFKVMYQTLNSIPQIKIHELSNVLCIEGKPTISELDTTHWSVKKVNLVKVLRAAGISCWLPE